MVDSWLQALLILVFGAENAPDDHGKPYESKRGAKSIHSSCFVEQEQPTSRHVLLPSSEERCTVPDVSQSVTVIRTQGSQKTISAHTEPGGSGEKTAPPALQTIWYF